jgi:hypothetical protein
MPDLDQSGTTRQWVTQYLGPSVGWVNAPLQNILAINSAGTFTLDPNTNFVEVSVVGAVTITLPSTLPSPAGAMAVPGSYLATPITMVDGCGASDRDRAEGWRHDHGPFVDLTERQLRRRHPATDPAAENVEFNRMNLQRWIRMDGGMINLGGLL